MLQGMFIASKTWCISIVRAFQKSTKTKTPLFLFALQEEAAKILLAEFNLGCDVQHTEHVYRVYVTTFLGFGGNFARQRYEDLVLNETLNKNRYIWHELCASGIECHQVAEVKKKCSYPTKLHPCFLFLLTTLPTGQHLLETLQYSSAGSGSGCFLIFVIRTHKKVQQLIVMTSYCVSLRTSQD